VNFTINKNDDHHKILLNGPFTFADSKKFREIAELVKKGGIGALELDFSEVEFIDSAGLGMLLLLRDECQLHQTNVSLRAAKGQVERIFTLSKFDQLFVMRG
jgi:anti-anti-sigma factor